MEVSLENSSHIEALGKMILYPHSCLFYVFKLSLIYVY